MAEREVLRTGKEKGDITKLCGKWGRDPSGWVSVSKSRAIQHIDDKVHRYFVQGRYSKVYVLVVNYKDGPRLRTSPDKTKANNLDNLLGC